MLFISRDPRIICLGFRWIWLVISWWFRLILVVDVVIKSMSDWLHFYLKIMPLMLMSILLPELVVVD